MVDVVDAAIHGDGHCIEVSRQGLYTLGAEIVEKTLLRAASVVP